MKTIILALRWALRHCRPLLLPRRALPANAAHRRDPPGHQRDRRSPRACPTSRSFRQAWSPAPPTAAAAIQQNSARMDRVLAALKRAGVADRDVQTSSISLNPEYRYQENQPPQLVGYTASNQVSIRFRDIRNSGQILDALVAEGANQINGPTLTIDKPETALDEARVQAIANGRARADLYARALGKRVVRLVSVSEGGGNYLVRHPCRWHDRSMAAQAADTKIVAGEQKLQVTVSMMFELQ